MVAGRGLYVAGASWKSRGGVGKVILREIQVRIEVSP